MNRSAALTAASNTGRAEAAYERLKSDIVAGQYRPGQRLIELDLAPRLGVSRATLRAAFQRLAQDGLVDLERNRGARVRAVSLGQALQIMRLREVLAGLSANLAAGVASDAELDQLEGAVDRMEQALAARDHDAYATHSAWFHERIVALARNPYLASVMASLSYPLVRLQFGRSFSGRTASQATAEMRAILDRLRARDADGAERAMRRYLAKVRRAMERGAGKESH
ncbi:MAG TPA: GntR family transcriptional regulator [Chloroflexota bacterium]